MTEMSAIVNAPWWAVFGGSFLFFAFLYFGFGFLGFLLSEKMFPVLGLGRSIGGRSVREGQLGMEMRYSLVSIAIFGAYGVLTQALVRQGLVSIGWTVEWSVFPVEVAVLFLWNELHFYLCHRLLHTDWLYRHVHVVHHRSTRPTPFSTFSFHWGEGVLLGSVMLTAMLWHEFSWLALLMLPLMSIGLNVLGHFHYDLFPGKPLEHVLTFSRRHSLHHTRNTGNYGFLLPVFDWAFGTRIPEKERVSETG